VIGRFLAAALADCLLDPGGQWNVARGSPGVT
jgi:hypothetical protein